MPRSEGRESSSRRSRSGRRSRSRHRDHTSSRHGRSRTNNRNKYKENNVLAAVFNMIAIVIICSALATPKWVSFSGGRCRIGGNALSSLGVNRFFYPGKFIIDATGGYVDKDMTVTTYQFGPNVVDKMEDCVTHKAVLLMKTMIAFTFVAIVCCLIAFILDLIGPTHRALKLLRRNAILSIISVILTVVVDLFCYWLTTEIEMLQRENPLHKGSKVIVDFDVSFYLITAAGCVSVFSTALNCLKRYPLYENSQGESLLEDFDEGMAGIDPTLIPVGPPIPEMSTIANLPPPPPYSP